MLGHLRDRWQRYALARTLGDKAPAEAVAANASFQTGLRRAPLHDRTHRRGRQRLADPHDPQPPEHRAFGQAAGFLQRCHCLTSDAQGRFIRCRRRARAGPMRLAVFQSLHVLVQSNQAQIAEVGGKEFTAPSPTTGKPKGEQGAITKAGQRAVAGGEVDCIAVRTRKVFLLGPAPRVTTTGRARQKTLLQKKQ